MAKNSITDYSKTASLNTDIQSVDIDEGCLPSGINNAIRELMADLAAMNDGTVTLTSPAFTSVDINGGTIDGVTIGGASAAAGTFTTLTASGDLTVDTNTLHVDSTNNRVGIGTSSPNGKLHVKDQTDIAMSNNADGQLIIEGNGYSGAIALSATGMQIYQNSSARNIIFGNNETEQMRIDSSGRVGIGTSSPSYKLHVDGSGTNSLVIEGTGTRQLFSYHDSDGVGWFTDAGSSLGEGIYLSQAGSNLRLYTNASERMRIDSSGRVGIGSASSLAALETLGNQYSARFFGTNTGNGLLIYHDETATIAKIKHTNSGGDLMLEAGTTSGLLFFNTAGSERMRIDSSGNLAIGKTASSGTTDNGHLIFASGVQYYFAAATTNINRFYNSTTGSQVGDITVGTSSTSFNTTSDYRLKENVTGITDGIERVKQLNPSRFNFIADADTTVDGFLAHEAATVVPEAVTGEKDAVDDDGNPVYQGIDQAKLVPLLTAALQEAITKIEDLEARVATLEGN